MKLIWDAKIVTGHPREMRINGFLNPPQKGIKGVLGWC